MLLFMLLFEFDSGVVEVYLCIVVDIGCIIGVFVVV